jgi:hypothetical protein
LSLAVNSGCCVAAAVGPIRRKRSATAGYRRRWGRRWLGVLARANLGRAVGHDKLMAERKVQADAMAA